MWSLRFVSCLSHLQDAELETDVGGDEDRSDEPFEHPQGQSHGIFEHPVGGFGGRQDAGGDEERSSSYHRYAARFGVAYRCT